MNLALLQFVQWQMGKEMPRISFDPRHLWFQLYLCATTGAEALRLLQFLGRWITLARRY